MSSGNMNSRPYVQKPGDWRVWKEKYNEECRLRNKAELKLYEQEWKPEHIWRSMWRYWFGGYDKEANFLFAGKLLTISRKVSFVATKGNLWIILFNKINYLRRSNEDYIIFDIWCERKDTLRMVIERKPFKIWFERIDHNAPSCG